MNRFGTVLIGAGFAFLVSTAQAATFNNSVGLSSPDQTIDFGSVALAFNQPVTTQFASLGVTFTDAFGNPDSSAYSNMIGNRIGNFEGGITAHPDFSMRFDNDLSAVGFAMVGGDGGVATAVAYLNSVAVETFVFNTSVTNPVNYYGFSDIVFDEVQIDVVSFDQAFMIDNLQISQTSAVPEPSTATLLLAAGLASIGFAARRRKMRH